MAYIDPWIRHSVFLDRYKSGRVRSIARFVQREMMPDIRAKAQSIATQFGGTTNFARRKGALLRRLAQLDDVVKGSTKLLHARIKGDLKDLARAEAEWTAQTMQRQLPLRMGYVMPAPQLLNAIVASKPMQGKFLRQWTGEVGANVAKRARQQIMLGVSQGESITKIIGRLRGPQGALLGKTVAEAQMVTRTAVNHVQTQARQAVIEENKQVADRIQWVSTLDPRTSQICASLDGLTWPINAGPRPPAHPNCRSDIIPVLKPLSNIPGIDSSKVPASTRATAGGPVSAKTTFGKWLKGQPDKVQNAVLGGSGKGDIFRRGKLPIEKFTDLKTLRPLKLNEVQALERKLLGTKTPPKPKPKPAPKPKPKPKPTPKPTPAKGPVKATGTTQQPPMPAPFVPAKTRAEARKRLREFVDSANGGPGTIGRMGDLDQMNAILEGLEASIGRQGIRMGALKSTKARRANGFYERRNSVMPTTVKNGPYTGTSQVIKPYNDAIALKLDRSSWGDPQARIRKQVAKLKERGELEKAALMDECPGWSTSEIAAYESTLPGYKGIVNSALRTTTIHEGAHAVYYHAQRTMMPTFKQGVGFSDKLVPKGLIADWEVLAAKLPKMEHYKISQYAAEGGVEELFAEAFAAWRTGKYLHPDIVSFFRTYKL